MGPAVPHACLTALVGGDDQAGPVVGADVGHPAIVLPILTSALFGAPGPSGRATTAPVLRVDEAGPCGVDVPAATRRDAPQRTHLRAPQTVNHVLERLLAFVWFPHETQIVAHEG